jgi:hydrogenase-4 component F
MTELLLCAVPALFGLLALFMPSHRKCLAVMLTGVVADAVLGSICIHRCFNGALAQGPAGWFFLDALSAFHLGLLFLVSVLSALFAWVYFIAELGENKLSLRQARLFSCLFSEALATMVLTLISNNLGIMWVGIEATTLVTAFLIYIHPSRQSLEAMWKYILLCSLGVAFAFMGTLLTAASAQGLPVPSHEAMLWTTLRNNAHLLNPALLKTAFIFILVGYGTKAGLAPLHNWLPDAHSQAPAPVSALFSGFMLNAALYCIMRFLPITEIALGGPAWTSGLLKIFGLVSIGVAAAFILFQRDLKRMLAFCSVEHMGIIALGLGLGGLGVFAALFHALNHSMAKSLSFFSAGRLGQIFGSHDMRKIKGSLALQPAWATGLFFSLLSLIGIAPFALFMSEFLIVKAAVQKGAFLSLAVFLLGAGVIFIGMLSRAIPMFWGKPDADSLPVKAGKLEFLLVSAPLFALLILGIAMPSFLKETLMQASNVIQAFSGNLMALSAGGRP